jgi:hypothetical protein
MRAPRAIAFLVLADDFDCHIDFDCEMRSMDSGSQ